MTAIEWCRNRDGSPGKTWNPIRARDKKTGKRGWHCEHVNEACRFCYAERLNVKPGDSGGTGLAYKPGHRADVEIYLDDKTLLAPLTWKKPQRIFPCSMTDLFGAWVSDAWLDRIFAVAALCPQHTFIVLTKRPDRMRGYFLAPHPAPNVKAWQARVSEAIDVIIPKRTAKSVDAKSAIVHHAPLPNVWGLVSCADQTDANAFIPILLDTPLAKRGVSLEPLLEPIDLESAWHDESALDSECWGDCAWCERGFTPLHNCKYPKPSMYEYRSGLDWVIAGGESGTLEQKPRAVEVERLRGLRDQCESAGVAFFFKQWGTFVIAEPVIDTSEDEAGSISHWVFPDGEEFHILSDGHDILMAAAQDATEAKRLWRDFWADGRGHLAKRPRDRKLDGREHNAWPDDPVEQPFR